MVNFIDLIKDIKGKKALEASNQADLDAYNKLLAGEDIDVQPTQQVVQQPVKQDTLLMGPDGKVDYNASVRLKQQTTPLSLADRLIGREVHIDKETIDPKTNEITTQRFSDYKPGFLNDFSAGYKENAATPISFNNFGQNKNPATRLGEGFGTAARLLDNPLMRGAIAYGLSNSMGDRRPLVQALNATVGTQQNRMKDRLYRDSLIEQMQNSIMNQEGFAELKPEEQQTLLRNAANRVNSYRGFIGDDTYKQILTGMQLQDNAAYRNALLKTQMNNQIIDNLLAQQKFSYQKQQDAIANQQKNRQLDIMENKTKLGTQKFRTAISDKRDALQQIKAMRELVNQNPNATGYIVGSFAKGGSARQKFANEFLSKNPGAIKTRAAISKLRGTTMHDLAGTAQTLQEQRNLAPFLPDATDNKKTILAKLDQLEAELTREMQTMLNTGMEYGYDFNNESFGNSSNNDPLGIR